MIFGLALPHQYNTRVNLLARRIAPFRLIFALTLTLPAHAQTNWLPLDQIQAGQKGIGRTVFSGATISEFNVEILGVLENIGPKQSVILARLSGGPLAHTGVMQGMSGSPVWINGKLIGAVALAFPFSKDPIAGIRPIAEMFETGPSRPGPARPLAELKLGDFSSLKEIATPVSFGGFPQATLDRFAPEWRKLGLEPRQGVSAGRPGASTPSARPIEPGSMISVHLMSGDLSVAAEGTVTAIDGRKLFAFGHRFLALGDAEMPFARAEVIALLPSLNTSFKISSAKEWLGTITADRNAAISGELGRKPNLIPVQLAVGPKRYQFEMVSNRSLSPLLLQMAAMAALDGTERGFGASTIGVRGQIRFTDRTLPPLRFDNIFTSDYNAAAGAGLAIASPLATLLEAAVPGAQVAAIELTLDTREEKRQMRIDQAWPSRRETRPGDEVELTMTFATENGAELQRRLKYRVPAGAENGPLYFSISDGSGLNAQEIRSLYAGGSLAGKTPAQVVDLLNQMRTNRRAYVRVWQSEPAYTAGSSDLSNVPKSVALTLSRATQGSATAVMSGAGSRLAEFPIDLGDDFVITGSKLVQVEVKN